MALFSKRHYIALAAQLNRTRNNAKAAADAATISWLDCIIEDLAAMLEHDNPRFNSDKFLRVSKQGEN